MVSFLPAPPSEPFIISTPPHAWYIPSDLTILIIGISLAVQVRKVLNSAVSSYLLRSHYSSVRIIILFSSLFSDAFRLQQFSLPLTLKTAFQTHTKPRAKLWLLLMSLQPFCWALDALSVSHSYTQSVDHSARGNRPPKAYTYMQFKTNTQ